MRITRGQLGRIIREEVKRLTEAPGRPATPDTGEFYADFDDDSGMYCVFHTDVDGHAFASFADQGEADSAAQRMNSAKTGSRR